MKKLLLILALGSLTATANHPLTGSLSPHVIAIVARYNTIEQHMKELTVILARVQDKSSAEAESATFEQHYTEMSRWLKSVPDPYKIFPEIKTFADRKLIISTRKAVENAGLSLQKELIRLAEAEFYGSATLIKTLQSLEILGDEADEFIR